MFKLSQNHCGREGTWSPSVPVIIEAAASWTCCLMLFGVFCCSLSVQVLCLFGEKRELISRISPSLCLKWLLFSERLIEPED